MPLVFSWASASCDLRTVSVNGVRAAPHPRTRCPGFCGLLEVLSQQLFSCSSGCLVIAHTAMPLNSGIPTQRFFCIQLNHGLKDSKCALSFTALDCLFIIVFSKLFLPFLSAEVTVLLFTLYFFSLFQDVLFYFSHTPREIKN